MMKTNPIPEQSAVARLLLASSMLEEGEREKNTLHNKEQPSTSVRCVKEHSPVMEGDHVTPPPFEPVLKVLKCSMCDYSTNDKSNFRRHKRLHIRNSPTTVLRCGKCDFSTVVPRKIREHYSQQHREDCAPSCNQDSIARNPTLSEHHFSNQHLEIPNNSCLQSRVVPTVHTLLAQPQAIQFTRTEPQILTNCITQYQPYEMPAPRIVQDNRIASDYLRSIVSNIITTHHTPRVPATSTITSSSSFYMPAPSTIETSITPVSVVMADMSDDATKLRVKVELVDESNVRHHDNVHYHPEVAERVEWSSRQHSSEVIDHNTNNISLVAQRLLQSDMHESLPVLVSREIHPIVDMNEVHALPSRTLVNAPTQSVNYVPPNINYVPIKLEMANVGVQCSIPIVKSEDSTQRVDDGRAFLVERSVQCELLSSGQLISESRVLSENSVDSQSTAVNQGSKCTHCGVTFEDEVLFSIHIGCHSHTDPFACNVCGRQCFNKYAFYSHIMRGHHL